MKKLLLNNQALAIIVIFSILALIAPFTLTREGPKWFDFTTTGEIGDTIGGLTAPFIGILNALLLFVTLRRQEEQIKMQREETENQKRHRQEDIITALIDRKTDLMNRVLVSLTLTIDYIPDSEKFGIDLADDIRGSYTGIYSLHIVYNYLFNESHPMLGYFKISPVEWSHFFTQMNFAIIEAGMALSKNYNSTLPDMVKKTNFEYITSQVTDIFILYGQVQLYSETYPNDPALKKLQISSLLDFKPKVDALLTLDPLPGFNA